MIRRFSRPCTHFHDGHYCQAIPTRPYITGARCDAHSPAALAGRTEITPDPALTLAGLRQAVSDIPMPLGALIDQQRGIA